MSRFANSQDSVRRARTSRVEITHTLHLPDGTQVQENLPLVIGVIADLTGDFDEDRASLGEPGRDFRHVHKDNFDEILAGAKPRLKYAVDNLLTGHGSLQVDLQFQRLEDFHPDRIVETIKPLREQEQRRRRLENLLNMLGGDPKLEAQLQEIIDDPEKRAQFLADMGRREHGGVDR